MQALGNIKIIKILGNQEYFKKNFDKHTFQYSKINAIHRTISESTRLVMEFFAITSLMILLLILLNLQKEDINTVLAQMTVYVVAIVRMMPSASKIMSALSTLSHNTKSVSTVYEDLQDNT